MSNRKPFGRASERIRLAEDVKAAAEARGAVVWFRPRFSPADPITVEIETACGMRGMLNIQPGRDAFTVHWFGSPSPLRDNPLYWVGVNPFHRRKATSYSVGGPALVRLVSQICEAAQHGALFQTQH
jgi:hypothetical protein